VTVAEAIDGAAADVIGSNGPALAGKVVIDAANRIGETECNSKAAGQQWAVRTAPRGSVEPERKPYGLLAECVDGPGATFRLGQPAG
jgi:hypothetical protein